MATDTTTVESRRWWQRKRLLVPLGLIVLLLVAARVIAPIWLEQDINQRLAKLEGYRGQIDDVDLSILAGSATVEGLELFEIPSGQGSPQTAPGGTQGGGSDGQRLAATVPEIIVDWHYLDLLTGRVVAALAIHRPEVQLRLTDAVREADPTGGLELVLPDMIPFTITEAVVEQASLRLIDQRTEPTIDLALTDCRVAISDVTNQRTDQDEAELPSELAVRATTPGEGSLAVDGRFDLSDRPVRFDIDASLEQMHLTGVNDVLEAFANLDVEAGTVDLSTELQLDGRDFDGYAKVIVTGLDVLRWGEEEGDGLLEKVWEAIAGGAAEILENQDKDSQAAKIPISGRLTSAEVSLSNALTSLLGHAFIRALLPGVEGDFQWLEVDRPQPEQAEKTGDPRSGRDQQVNKEQQSGAGSTASKKNTSKANDHEDEITSPPHSPQLKPESEL